MGTTQAYDVAIIAGSSGLGAALILARARRSVVVIDGGAPRNAPASSARGLLGQDGVNPLELLKKGRDEAATYGAHIMQAEVRRSSGTADEGFALALDDAWVTRARFDGLEGLGVDVTDNTAGVAVVADAAGHTSVPVCGRRANVVNPGTQVSKSAANGRGWR